jgi:hypothetical protein
MVRSMGVYDTLMPVIFQYIGARRDGNPAKTKQGTTGESPLSFKNDYYFAVPNDPFKKLWMNALTSCGLSIFGK